MRCLCVRTTRPQPRLLTTNKTPGMSTALGTPPLHGTKDQLKVVGRCMPGRVVGGVTKRTSATRSTTFLWHRRATDPTRKASDYGSGLPCSGFPSTAATIHTRRRAVREAAQHHVAAAAGGAPQRHGREQQQGGGIHLDAAEGEERVRAAAVLQVAGQDRAGRADDGHCAAQRRPLDLGEGAHPTRVCDGMRRLQRKRANRPDKFPD